MHIGIMLQNYTMRGGAVQLAKNLATAAASAEAAGLDNVWVLDHFFQIPAIGPAETDMLESYSVLAFMAAHTKRVRLGTLVTGVTYRHPGLLVKTATTLDVLSGGRLVWNRRGLVRARASGAGRAVSRARERFERLEETLQIALQMWSPNNGPYHGRHYQLQETLCVPQPLSRPRLPILIGGGGEKKTLRLVAQYADACNVLGDAATVAAKLEVLRGHCMRLGRDYDAIKKTANVPYQRDSGKLLAELASLAAVGVQSAILTNVDPTEEQFSKLWPRALCPRPQVFRAGRLAPRGELRLGQGNGARGTCVRTRRRLAHGEYPFLGGASCTSVGLLNGTGRGFRAYRHVVRCSCDEYFNNPRRRLSPRQQSVSACAGPR